MERKFATDGTLTNAGICLVRSGGKAVDIGNYYTKEDGEKVLVTSRDLAERYGHLVSCAIYIRRGL